MDIVGKCTPADCNEEEHLILLATVFFSLYYFWRSTSANFTKLCISIKNIVTLS